jgi:urease accessory protein UreE
MRDTIDMAREAGFELGCTSLEWHKRIKAFEALVRADERELCAKVCHELANQHAKYLCRADVQKYQLDRATGALNGCMHSMEAIRARGETK